jgi:hypothetical protein
MHRAVFWFSSILPVILLMSAILPLSARAEGIGFNSQLRYSWSDSKTTDRDTGETSNSKSYRFDQRYNLDLTKTLYPYLSFRAGTFYEVNTSKSLTDNFKTEETTLQPVVGLTLNNPLYQTRLQYTGTRRTQKTTNFPKIDLSRDDLISSLVWSPADLPLVDLRYNWTHTYDHPKTVDVVDKLLTLKSSYTAWEELNLTYIYTRLDTDDRMGGFDTLNQTHFGTANYTHNFLNDRLLMNSNYAIRYNTVEFPGAETVQLPLQPSEGLSAVNSDPPDDGPALTTNNGLIDGNLTASAGINIGSGANQTQIINIGLSFSSARDVDQIYIYVNSGSRALTAAIADSFSWRVYTSPDNTDTSTWTLVATVFPASFAVLDNRFEMSFTKVNTQYIKVVTTALPLVLDPGNEFTDIFVTEMEPFSTLSGAQVNHKFTTLDQNYNLNLTARLSDKTSLGYSLQYFTENQDSPAEDSSQLFNNIFLNHTFNEIFSSSATFSRGDTKQGDRKTTTYSYGTSLRGNYLPTFNQTLTLSGSNESEEEGSAYTYSIFLHHNAILYSGWSAFFDVSRTWNLLVDDTRNASTIIRTGTNIIPNSIITLNLSYNYTLTDSKPPQGNNKETTNKILNVDVFFTPFRALSLSASINYVEREDFSSTLQQYSVNWSPFPEGDLQFFFIYNETLENEQDREETSLGPGFNWKISNHFSLRSAYTYVQGKSSTQKVESNNLLSELTIIF